MKGFIEIKILFVTKFPLENGSASQRREVNRKAMVPVSKILDIIDDNGICIICAESYDSGCVIWQIEETYEQVKQKLAEATK